MTSLRLLALLFLAGCEWIRLPSDYAVRDADGDGYDSLHDCDDFNEYAHPGGVETCNGVDNNCSGSESDASDATVYYRDADGDEFGDPGDYLAACSAPIGYVSYPYDCDDGDADYSPRAPESCDDTEDYNCDGFLSFLDTDQDGWVECEECDDGDPLAFPGAEERCNGKDDDCDGEADEGLEPINWYTDADGDGWGDPSLPVLGCARPDDASADGTDCDDANADVHPDAQEACDALDNDCDALVDEDDRFGNTWWYLDADGDGYGDAGDWVASCTPLDGRVEDATDCDDASFGVNPGAAEHCDDVDEDCDGTADDSAVDAPTWYSDRDGDRYGDATRTRVQCDVPSSAWTADGTDCDDGDEDVHPDAPELCNDADDDCDLVIDEDATTDAPAWYTDGDGDGYGDAASGSYSCTQPPGTVADGTDCNDTDAAYYPGALEIDCDDPADYNCDGSSGLDDADADGWAACEDCDDADATRNPAEVEVCDGRDEDCDGRLDDNASDATAWYTDVDGDGYGDPATEFLACGAPVGRVANGTDCDDADATISPGVNESCATAYDDDCDGATDDEDADGCTEWYIDADLDGYGGDESACLCASAGDYTAAATEDCDDANADVNPAATEVCGSGIDDDCDGAAPGCGIAGEASLADAASKVLGVNASDLFASALAGPGDVDGDGLVDIVAAASTADDAANDAGAVWLLHGPVSDALGSPSFLGEVADDRAGAALAAGDIDRDGYPDLLVGASGDDSGGTEAGATYLVLGPLEGASSSLSSASAKLLGVAANDCAGCALAITSDGDGDGLPEILVGAHRESGRSGGAGAVYVWDTVPSGTVDVDGASARLMGSASGDFFGRAVANAGDTDGDGLDDVVVGAYGDDSNGSNSGCAWLFLGPLAGDMFTADAGRWGAARSDNAGFSVAGGGDVDGDGYADFVVGAVNNDDAGSGAGAAYLVHGPITGRSSLADEATLLGEDSGDNVGGTVGIADLNDDTYDDVFVSGDGANRGQAGATWVVYGPFSGVLSLTDAEGVLVGETIGDDAGGALLAPGDIDGDGFGDVVIGASQEDTAASNAGALYTWLGGVGL